MYDAIVVGARCAGAPTAMLLARHGYRVLLVDRARFPSDTLSTLFLPPRGAASLARWGLLDRLRAVSGDPEPVAGQTEVYCPRRTVLDGLLVEAAVAAGCELREATTVEALVWEGGRVVGITGRRKGGQRMVERAALVVGADGRRSRVAGLAGATAYDGHPPLTAAFYTYWRGLGARTVTFHMRAGRHIYVFPTHDGLTCVQVTWPASEFAAFRADVAGNYRRTLALVPDLAARVRESERVAPFRGTGTLPNYYRASAGPGWALVGDAGHHKDPAAGSGMSDAFRDAELLAAAVHRGWSGAASLDDELRRYELERNQRSRHVYQWALRAARLADPAPLVPFLAAVEGDPAERTRLVSVLTGTVPFWEVFGEENMQRVLGRRS
jgi:2-polyprenyl-6-methoxyphenol hydroxylase-like FAD-dependent oxidoreductase